MPYSGPDAGSLCLLYAAVILVYVILGIIASAYPIRRVSYEDPYSALRVNG